MQGFFISANATGNFVLNDAYRTHTTGTFFKDKQTTDHYICLSVSGNNITDKLYIRFNDDATDTFDGAYDAWKLMTWNEASPQLYSFSGEEILSIDQRPECDMIKLGFFMWNTRILCYWY